MSKKWILICVIIPSLTLLAIATFIWPTPYKYERYMFSFYRINRYTGETHTLTGGRWTKQIPPEELFKIIITADVQARPDVTAKEITFTKVNVYNGSTRTVAGLLIKLGEKVLNCGGPIKSGTSVYYTL